MWDNQRDFLSLLGNRAGRGYNPNQQVVVGGRSSVDIGEHKSSLRGRGYRHSTQGRGVSWAPDTVDKDFDRSAGKPLFTDLDTSTGVCIHEANGDRIVVTTTNHLL